MIISTATIFCLASAAMFAVTPKSAPNAGVAEVFRFSFENVPTRDYDGDRDYDGQPDDWTRRRGPDFPHYVQAVIDRTHAAEGVASLHYKANGGQIAMYSPITDQVGHIDPKYSYIFHGYIRTQRLEHAAALISVSLLNHKRQRIQRFLTVPVSGTHESWVPVTLGPITPLPDVRFIVIGCHLVHNKEKDFRGDVWFDDLWLGQLPRLSLLSNFTTHFREGGRPIEIMAHVSGLDPAKNYELRLQMKDSQGTILREETIPYRRTRESVASELADAPSQTGSFETWKLPPQKYGFYRVRATLVQDDTTILSKETTLAVMDLVSDRHRVDGEFGWTVARGTGSLPLSDLPLVASEAGINWLKFPLWQSVGSENTETSVQVSELLESLTRAHITPVGLLNKPPRQLRAQFAHNWLGTSEVFAMPPSFWTPFLEPVIARYSSNVRYWQLSGDDDNSFTGLDRLNETLSVVKREFDRIGRGTHIGIHWDSQTPIPSNWKLSQTFLSVSLSAPVNNSEFVNAEAPLPAVRLPRWTVLKPLPSSSTSDTEQASDLVKRMVATKIRGADAIFAWDVFDPEYGMLHQDGSPKPLFLPWRTAALSLQGAEYLGSLQLSGGSHNYAFARDGSVSLFIWSEKSTREEVYLGENVTVSDLWGRQQPLPLNPQTHRHIISAGPVPIIVHGCSESIARWRLAVQFQRGRLRSEYGGHQESILGTNTFPQGINGTASIVLPRDWEVEPRSWKLTAARGEPFQLPMRLTLPSDASLGTDTVYIDFNIVADRKYQFRIQRPYQVGLGDITVEVHDRKLKDGRLEIEQIITNKTSPLEVLDFSCHLFIPGHKRQKQFVTRLGNDKDRRLYYIPNADLLRGRELRLRAEQIGGRRVLNKRWIVGKNWDKPAEQRVHVENTSLSSSH